MIVLHALGTAEIDTGVTTLTPSQEIVFAAALYLILERGKRVGRERLASLLWPRVPEKARAHRLRQTILQLKKLGLMIRADRDNLQLSQFDARTDIEDLSGSDPAPFLKKDSLEFLPGYTPRLSEQLRDWVESKRGEVHSLATKILVSEIERSRSTISFSMVSLSTGSEDSSFSPSAARKSEVKLLRSPSARVLGSQRTRICADASLT